MPSDELRPFSISAAAAEAPDHPALVAGSRAWTYRELAEEIRNILPWLRLERRESAPSQPAALYGKSSVDTLIALYALLESQVPVALFHPAWARTERHAHLETLSPHPILGENWRASLPGPLESTQTPPKADLRSRFFALVFTSGSGGAPKGAVLPHQALAAAAAASAEHLGWRDDDRWLLSLPVAHVGGLSIVTRCLAARKTVVLASSPRFDPQAFDAEIRRHRVTLVSLVPTMLRRLLDWSPSWQPPASLRAILLGGAPAAPDLLAEAADRGLPLLSTYGLTEASSQVATQAPGSHQRGELGVGKPLPGIQVRIRKGEIQVAGPQLMAGYWPLGEASQPFTEDGFLPTGDLGRLDEEGNLHVLGRRSQLIISGGENVHPAEVEAVLCGHPSIAAAIVFGIEDREWGQQVAAALVATGKELLDVKGLRAYLETRLAPFKHPRQIAYLEALPLLANGKVDRKAAVALALPRIVS